MRHIKLTAQSIEEILAEVKKKLTSSHNIEEKVTYKIDMSAKKPAGVPENALIIMSPKAYYKMQSLVNACNKEVGWHGVVERGEDTEEEAVFHLTDILVFPQEVTATTVTPDETEYSMWLSKLPDEVFNKLRFHGHSHVRMGVSPSGTDTQYQDQLLSQVNDFYIFGIFNKHGNKKLFIYDMEANALYEPEDIELTCLEIAKYEAWTETAIEKYVKEPPKNTTPYLGKALTASMMNTDIHRRYNAIEQRWEYY